VVTQELKRSGDTAASNPEVPMDFIYVLYFLIYNHSMINFSYQEFAAVLFSFSEFLDIYVLIFWCIHGGIPPDGFSWTKAIKAFIQKGKFCFFLCDFSELYNWAEIEALQISPANIFIGIGYGLTTFIFFTELQLNARV